MSDSLAVEVLDSPEMTTRLYFKLFTDGCLKTQTFDV